MTEGHLPAPARPLAQGLIAQAEGLGQALQAGSPTALAQARALAGQAEALLGSVVWAPGEEWPACRVEGERSLSSGDDFALLLRGSDLVLAWGDSSLSLTFRTSGDCLAGYECAAYVLTATECVDETAFKERSRAQDARLDKALERPIPSGQLAPGASWEGAAEESLGGDWLRWLGTAVRQVAPGKSKGKATAKKTRAEEPARREESAQAQEGACAAPVDGPTPEERPTARAGSGGSCRSCHSELVDGARFCSVCGKSTTPSCPACGVTVPAHAAFCHDCGQPIRSA
ncbi:MAG: hypothetical protein AMXMBFR33_09690 [Candidatus Xenobia bacterium]